MRSSALLLVSLGLLAGCERNRVNPPTEPATAIESRTMDASAEAPSDSIAPMLPGAGPTSFVGRWSKDPSWCTAPAGQNRAFEITTMRFEGNGSGCDIAHIDQVTGGYQATLSCPVQGGMPKVERVQMSVVGQTLELAYVDRGPRSTNPPVKLLKCTTLGDTSTKGPALPVP